MKSEVDSEELSLDIVPIQAFDFSIVDTRVFTDTKVVMLPSKFFVPSKAVHFLKSKYPTVHPDHVQHCPIDALDAILIFASGQKQKPTKNIEHLLQLMIDASFQISSVLSVHIYMFYDRNGVWMVVNNFNKILLAEWFQVRGKADIAFYAAAMIEQFGLKPNTPIVLGGAITTEGKAYKSLLSYFNVVSNESVLKNVKHNKSLRLLTAYSKSQMA